MVKVFLFNYVGSSTYQNRVKVQLCGIKKYRLSVFVLTQSLPLTNCFTLQSHVSTELWHNSSTYGQKKPYFSQSAVLIKFKFESGFRWSIMHLLLTQQ